MDPRRKLIILGTYAFAEEVADLVSECPEFELVGFGENFDRDRCRQPFLGLPVRWIDELAPLAATHQFVCAITTTHRRHYIEQAAALGLSFATVRHPTARVAPTSTIGAGSILSAGVIVAAHTRIGRQVIINRGCLIGHHTVIGDGVTIQPGANVAGRVVIGDGAYIAMGAIILNDRKIGASALVGAGALVTKDVPDRVQVMGLPARITKENIEGR